MFTLGQRLKAVLHKRCPRCLKGSVFTGMTSMHKNCPECGYQFEREPGYFLGAMYASYFMAIPVLLLITLAIWWLFLPQWPLHHVVLVAAVPFLLTVPTVFRYSRIIWMHFDHP